MKVIKTTAEIFTRLDNLQDVLSYTTLHAPSKFNVGERIYINHERSALFTALNRINEGNEGEVDFQLSTKTAKKVTEVLKWIHQSKS